MIRWAGEWWRDDTGSVIASEYLLLGVIVVLGALGALTAVRDATSTELRQFAVSIREIRNQSVPREHSPAQRPADRMGSPTFDPEVVP